MFKCENCGSDLRSHNETGLCSKPACRAIKEARRRARIASDIRALKARVEELEAR